MSASSPVRVAAPPRRPRRRVWLWVLGVLLLLLLIMQLARFVVPDFRLDNPPVTRTVTWDSPETQQLFMQSCGDCHSNESVYPWYAQVAPVGWLVAHDIHEGRSKLNISENGEIEWDEMVEEIREGGMPLPIYLPLHPEARLTDAERETLINGIEATFR